MIALQKPLVYMLQLGEWPQWAHPFQADCVAKTALFLFTDDWDDYVSYLLDMQSF